MAKISITTHPTIAHLFAILILILASGGSFCASAYTMPADKLLAMSNKQLCYKGYDFYLKSQRDSALICYNIVASRADKKQSREELDYACSALTTMANIFIIDFYDYERSMQCLLKAKQIALKNNLNERLAHIFLSMASLEGQINDIQANFAFSRTVFELYRKTFHQSLKQENGQRYTALAIINLITLALGHHKLDLILNELEMFQGMTINDTIPICVYAKHQCSAALFIQHQQYDSALLELMRLNDCLSMAEDMAVDESSIYKAITHENLFFVYRDMKDHDAALYELDQLEIISEQSNIKYGLIEVLFLKRDYYASLGNTALAEKYDLQYHKAKDQFMTEAKVAKADEEKVLFKLNEANHETKELSYKQRIQQTKLIAVAVVAVLLLALLVLGWLSHRRTKEKNRSLYLQNQQLLANIDRMRQLRQEQDAPTEKYGRGKMEDDDIAQVMLKVERVMDESEEIFSTEFSLDRLAELTGETESRLSQALNTSGRKFYELLNEYRVREACRRMDDKDTYSGLTIEAIGQSVGFKNRSHFVTTFKRLTGLTPSAYFKQPHDRTPPQSPP